MWLGMFWVFDLFLIDLSSHPTNKILVFKKNLGIYSQTQTYIRLEFFL